MPIDLQEVVDFIATQPLSDDLWQKVAARWPLSREEFLKVTALLRAQAKAADAEAATMGRLAGIARRYDFGPDNPSMSLAEALRRGAAAGDAEATAAITALISPERRAWNAVFEAAAERHPDWRPVPKKPGTYHGPRTKDHPERDPQRLVAWYERTYPAEAAQITAEVMGN